MKQVLIIVFILSLKTEAQSSVLTLADSLYAIGNYTKAIQQYNLQDENEKANDRLAKSYLAIGNYGKALTHYKKHLEIYPEQFIIKYEYAKLLSRTKNYSEAKIIFKELLETDYRNANYYYELGALYEAKKEYSNAEKHYVLVINLDSSYQKAIYKLSKLLLKKKDYKQVDSYVDLGLKSYPDNASLISLKAQSAYYQKNYWPAISSFEKLVELGENSKFIYERLSKSYAMVYNDLKAIEYMKLALALEPNNANNLYLLGRFYLNIEQYEEAEIMVSKSIALQNLPLDKKYMKLAKIYNYLKQPQNAIKAYGNALRENPKNESAAFFEAFTKDHYYKDFITRIKVYEVFKNEIS